MPGCWIAQISDEQLDAATEVEEAIHVGSISPLPLGIEREVRCMGAGLVAWKGSMAS